MNFNINFMEGSFNINIDMNPERWSFRTETTWNELKWYFGLFLISLKDGK